MITHEDAPESNGIAVPSGNAASAASGDYRSTEAADASVIAADSSLALPRRGLLDHDWQKVLVVLLTVLAGLALTWVLWQVLSPISRTLILFGLAAVLAFALSGPVTMVSRRTGNRLLAIVAVYLLVGVVVVGGLTLLAGPFVRDATALSGALPQYAADLQARAPEVQSALGQYGVQTDVDQLKARAVTAVEQGGADVLRNLVGTLAEVGGIILDIVLALVISLYLLVDGPRFRVQSLALVPAFAPRRCFWRTTFRVCLAATCVASSPWA